MILLFYFYFILFIHIFIYFYFIDFYFCYNPLFSCRQGIGLSDQITSHTVVLLVLCMTSHYLPNKRRSFSC